MSETGFNVPKVLGRSEFSDDFRGFNIGVKCFTGDPLNGDVAKFDAVFFVQIDVFSSVDNSTIVVELDGVFESGRDNSDSFDLLGVSADSDGVSFTGV